MSDCAILDSGDIYVPGINKILSINIKENPSGIKKVLYASFLKQIIILYCDGQLIINDLENNHEHKVIPKFSHIECNDIVMRGEKDIQYYFNAVSYDSQLLWKCVSHNGKFGYDETTVNFERFSRTATKISLDSDAIYYLLDSHLHKIDENGDNIVKSDVVDFAYMLGHEFIIKYDNILIVDGKEKLDGIKFDRIIHDKCLRKIVFQTTTREFYNDRLEKISLPENVDNNLPPEPEKTAPKNNVHSYIEGDRIFKLCCCPDCDVLYDDWCRKAKEKAHGILPKVRCHILKPGEFRALGGQNGVSLSR